TNMSIPWCIVAAPGRKWADKIFGSNQPDNYNNLSNALMKILRLDNGNHNNNSQNNPAANPVETWKTHGGKLKERAIKLTGFNLDKIVFAAEGTVLEVGLIPGGKYNG